MDGLWKEGFRHASRYNAETNEAMYAALDALPGNALSADRGSYFGSLIGLLNHLIVTDIHWLDRYRALCPDAKSLSDGRLAAFPLSWEPLSDNFSVLADRRPVVDDLICEWFDEFPEERYGESFTYRDSKGSMHQAIASRAFDFLFLHQAHHRGQISQVMDSLGVRHNFADNGEFLTKG
jgi:uncharacterized damage-inducible protein DinB